MNAHIGDVLLARYASGDGVAADALWALEAHLESCAPCRSRLGSAVRRAGSPTAALLERVQRNVEAEVARSPQMPRRMWPQRLARWSPPGLLPRLTMSLVVLGAALGLDLAGRTLPPLVLLVAPVAPLLGVAAVWSARLDPEHELVVASPRAGLYLVLRRTLAVLVVVMPALGLAGWLTGASPARWLVPCLAFTAGALALGELIGLRLAAGILAFAWTAGVITPSVITTRTPPVLDSSSLPYWAGLFVATAIALAVRRDAYTGWRSGKWFAQ